MTCRERGEAALEAMSVAAADARNARVFGEDAGPAEDRWVAALREWSRAAREVAS